MTYVYIFGGLGVIETAGIVWAVALCKAAARKPVFGPPLSTLRGPTSES